MFEKSPAGVRRRKSVCDRERGLLWQGRRRRERLDLFIKIIAINTVINNRNDICI